MEATENREEMEILPDQEEGSTLSAMSSDKSTEPKDGDREEDDDGEQLDGVQNGPSKSRKDSQAKSIIPPDSATKNMSENYSTHHSNATTIPAKPNSTQSTLSD